MIGLLQFLTWIYMSPAHAFVSYNVDYQTNTFCAFNNLTEKICMPMDDAAKFGNDPNVAIWGVKNGNNSVLDAGKAISEFQSKIKANELKAKKLSAEINKLNTDLEKWQACVGAADIIEKCADKIQKKSDNLREQLNKLNQELNSTNTGINHMTSELLVNQALLKKEIISAQKIADKEKDDQRQKELDSEMRKSYINEIKAAHLNAQIDSIENRLSNEQDNLSGIEKAYERTLMEGYVYTKLKKLAANFCNAKKSCDGGSDATQELLKGLFNEAGLKKALTNSREATR